MGEGVIEREEENWVGIRWFQKEKCFSVFMAADCSDFVDNYKTSIFDPGTPAVAHIAPIYSRWLSMYL